MTGNKEKETVIQHIQKFFYSLKKKDPSETQSEAISAFTTVPEPPGPEQSDEEIMQQHTLLDFIQPEMTEAESDIQPNGETVSYTLDLMVDRIFLFFGRRKGQIKAFYRRRRENSIRRRAAFSASVTENMERAVDRFEQAVDRGSKPACAVLKVCRFIVFRYCRTVKRIRRACRRAGLFLAGGIDRIDRGIGFLADHTNRAAARIKQRGRQLVGFVVRRRKAVIAGCSVFVCGLIVAAAGYQSTLAYEYAYNGKVLGLVKNQQDVLETVDLMGDRLAVAYDAEIHIDSEKDIIFDRVKIEGRPLDTQEDILNNLTYMKDMKVRGFAIIAEGKRVAVVQSEETAQQILDRVRQQYLNGEDPRNFTKIEFAEDVEIREVGTRLDRLQDSEEVFEYMMTGAVEKKIHNVIPGDTLSRIANNNGMTTAELLAINPDVVPERMQIGQEIKLQKTVPLLSVETTEVATWSEEMPCEIEYEETASMYQGDQIVKLEGKNGQKEVTAEIIKLNGVETGRTEIASKVLVEPVAQEVLIGTKETPALIGQGYFQYPMRGRLTSRFGQRWGRMHNGIDLAAATGTPIGAADGGKVTFAGYNGSLGYMVRIDHGGNRETVYGHCSRLHVSVGDQVYQGQHIADVGNTGRSTGPHLHFEVHINGSQCNPLDYL